MVEGNLLRVTDMNVQEAAKGTYVTEIAKLFPPQGEWTEMAYFALPESTQIIELSDGVLIMPPAPTIGHQNVSGELYSALKAFVETNDLGRVFYAPLAVRLWPGKIREPDILFIRKENENRIGETRIDGPPDWVAEIVSPGTRQADEHDKVREYAQARVSEYWLVDPENKTIRVYVLETEEQYNLAATYEAGQTARSETIKGFEVAVDDVIV